MIYDYSFSQKRKLNQHFSSLHKGKKTLSNVQFVTSIFLEKGNLNKLVASVHAGNKPFKCRICNLCMTKSFMCEICMPICEVCDYRSTKKGTLKRHVSPINEVKKSFKCKIDLLESMLPQCKKVVSSVVQFLYWHKIF